MLLKDNNLVLATFSSQTFDSVQPFHLVLKETAEIVETPMVLIDCDAEAELCREHDVNEYPVMRLFKQNQGEEMEVKRYRGRKTKRGIQSFVTKHQLPTLTHIEPKDLGMFKKIDDVVIVAYLPPDQDERLEVFRSIAINHHEDFVFGYVTDLKSAEKERVEISTIVCYKNSDHDNKVLKGYLTEADVDNFLETATKTLIGEFSERNMELYMTPGKLAAYIFATTEDEATSMRYELTPVAKRFAQYVTFGVADAFEYGPMAKNFGLVHNIFPALAIHAPINDNVFIYLQGREIVASTVEAMLMTILQGKATSGQVFGREAPELEEGQTMHARHDEL
ncbi:hypothetical protein N0V90_008319 [Kalmusia sp. IMI 367209]|nr:hypothetical protein N0V90_008319 [Kalmusia sp. IMI 367209]